MSDILTLALGPLGTNCYIVADAEGNAAVIDPGGDAPVVLRELAARHWRAAWVLLTHGHFDHIGAVEAVMAATGAKLAAPQAELGLLRVGGGATAFGLPAIRVPEPDLLLEPGSLVRVGGLTFEVLFVPGHTLGHVAFYSPAHQAVFSGDVLFADGIGRTDLPGGDYVTLMHSIRDVLFSLPGQTAVYPGHGPATTIDRERRLNPFLAA
jgi:glyoxylase-like metal-dependent hydrolase (beta-lactamase superfamily II)